MTGRAEQADETSAEKLMTIASGPCSDEQVDRTRHRAAEYVTRWALNGHDLDELLEMLGIGASREVQA